MCKSGAAEGVTSVERLLGNSKDQPIVLADKLGDEVE